MNKVTKDAVHELRDSINTLKAQGFNDEQIKKIVSGIIYGFPDSKLDVLVNPKLNHKQMEEIYAGFMGGLSIKSVRTYAKIENSSNKMRKLRIELVKEKMGID